MTNYKKKLGKGVRFLSSNLDNDQAEGQIWYNSTDGAFKNVLINEAWASGGALINARRGGASGGTQTAGLAFGGRIPPGTNVADTEEYNGSGWSSGGDLGTARYNLASATNAPQTAGLAFGSAGSPDTTTEEYNGTSWTAGGGLNTGRGFLGGAGTQTAGLGFGGYAGGDVNNVEEYNGTSWTAVTAMPSARRQMGGVGLQTAALSIGAYGSPSDLNVTEEYDGTNWTSGGTYPQVIKDVKAAGIQTNSLAFGGTPPPSKTTLTTNYDGTSWTTKPSMATARTAHFGAGTASAAFAAGGLTGAPPGPSSTAFTEEFTRSTNVITGAAWASAANMNTARGLLASAGTTQNAQLGAGGYSPAAPSNNTWANVEEYNGTSWSEVNDIPAIKSRFAGVGSQTSAATFGGFTPLGPNTNYATTEEYDGTNWTSGGNLNTARCYMSGFGIQTAAVCAGGATLNPDVGFNKTEEYNGTSWSEVNNMPNFFRNQGGVGVLTAGVITGGKEGPSSSYPGITVTTTTLEYDGTNWTSGGTNLIPGGNVTGGGTQSVAWFAGNPVPSGNVSTHYNGTSFVTSAACAESHAAGGGGAPQTSGIIFGDAAEYNNKTEEFTGETSALNVKTISTS